jgi:hypothetical protein
MSLSHCDNHNRGKGWHQFADWFFVLITMKVQLNAFGYKLNLK